MIIIIAIWLGGQRQPIIRRSKKMVFNLKWQKRIESEKAKRKLEKKIAYLENCFTCSLTSSYFYVF